MPEKLLKPVFFSAGFISLGLGFAGVFLPVLPTTPFVLLSAFCFAKSSERFHRYLLNHRIFGRTVRDFQQKRIIAKKTKVKALFSMWIMLTLSIVLCVPNMPLRLIVALIGVAATIYIISFPSN